MALSSLPVELLIAIFSLACTDHGRTGCALNVTSKAFRDICLNSSVDLQCVAVLGGDKFQRFTDTLNLREHRRVTSLLLSDESEYYPVISDIWRLIFTILHAISPRDLRILHVSLDIPEHHKLRTPLENSSFAWLPISFPSLVDLQLPCHVYHPSFPSTHTAVSPALQSLRIKAIPQGLGAMLEREFPNLTDLTIDIPVAPYTSTIPVNLF
ncbi:hypothetical protein EIP91_004065 [Steccherinum ochraceum]|uniref:F-box domain-containing protein n=1 Tax=Steccherinum ochraceum TaxID=92696 RepID=A0A4R0R9H2_9APHY|nr:hypothetical protein EIP91_004065 [Steccherinum ochraceum]